MAVKKKKIAKAKPAKAKKVAKAAKAAKPAKKPAKPAAKKTAKAEKPAKADKKAAKKAPPVPTPASKKTPTPVKKVVVEEVVVEAAAPDEAAAAEEVILTDADGRRYCRVKDCDQVSTVDGYCRYHYLMFWKKIQVRKKILSEGKLERYIEELTARYPDKFLDMLRKDLRSEKEFLAAIQELEIDESSQEGEFEDETQTYIDEVRGISESTPTSDDGEF